MRRERLLDRLRPAPGVRLTLIAAPAGCGKTTLISFGGVVLGVDHVVAAMMRRTVPRGLDTVARAA